MAERRHSDAYVWRVQLAGGNWVTEAEAGSFTRLPLAEVTRVELLPVGGGLLQKRRPLALAVPAGATPVFFRRRRGTVVLGEGALRLYDTLTCLGYEAGGQGAYMFVTDEGEVTLSASR